MRPAHRITIPALILAMTPVVAAAQTALPPSRVPPNAIDRALDSDSSRIASDAARRDADRARADQAARAAMAARGPVAESTMTDRFAGPTSGIPDSPTAPAPLPPVPPQS